MAERADGPRAQAWQLALSLAQDDDDVPRGLATEALSVGLAANAASHPKLRALLSAADAPADGQAQGVALLPMAAALELGVGELARALGGSCAGVLLQVRAVLSGPFGVAEPSASPSVVEEGRCVGEAARALAGARAAAAAVGGGAVAEGKALFDVEQPNLFVDEIYYATICARALADALTSGGVAPGAAEELRALAERVATALAAELAGAMVALCPPAMSSQHATVSAYDAAVFAPLCRTALALHALRPLLADGGELALAEVRATALAFAEVGHPMVSAIVRRLARPRGAGEDDTSGLLPLIYA
ncbi:hypothetical protein T492DRAFT_261540 [Pavlovales sp. CCMP2436]|nr:hypothetical protein T492DRAFT_261540 [Pavlovales sp. CCMP2436]